MKDYILKPGSFIAKSTIDSVSDVPGLSLEKYIVKVLNGETCCVKNIVADSLTIGELTPVSSSAIVQINSTTQGFLFPRMTTAQRDAISSPANGLIIYNTTDSILNIWDGTEWTEVGGGGLGLKDGLLMTSTLTEVVDKENTESALLLSTNRVGISADPTATTQAMAVIQATTLNSGIAIVPNGTGAITANVPDGTTTGGNARGQYAVDLQMVRNTAGRVASGTYSVVMGGSLNTSSGNNSTTSGYRNTASGNGSVALGWENNASGIYAIALGNFSNASSNYSTVSGGQNNTASTGLNATVVGGQGNTSSGQHSISGGSGNAASGQNSTAFGGSNNAQSQSSVTLGQQNVTSQPYSFSSGYFASSYLYGQESRQNGRFDSAGDAQASQLIARKFDDLTTGGTTVLSLDGTGITNLIIPTNVNRVWNVVASWVAVVIGTSGTTTGVNIGDVITQCNLFAFKKIAGISSVVGSVTNVATHNDAGMASASMGYTAGASQELALTFTAPTFSGGGSVTLRIVNKLMLTEVAY
jgi:hypothetical protein